MKVYEAYKVIDGMSKRGTNYMLYLRRREQSKFVNLEDVPNKILDLYYPKYNIGKKTKKFPGTSGIFTFDSIEKALDFMCLYDLYNTPHFYSYMQPTILRVEGYQKKRYYFNTKRYKIFGSCGTFYGLTRVLDTARKAYKQGGEELQKFKDGPCVYTEEGTSLFNYVIPIEEVSNAY